MSDGFAQSSPDAPVRQSSSAKKWIRRIIALSLMLLIVSALFRAWNREALKAVTINRGLLLASIAVVVCYFFASATGWWLILKVLDTQISLRQSLKCWFISLGARYIPGRVATVLSRAYLCEAEQVSKKKVVLASILEQILTTTVAVMVSFLALSGLTGINQLHLIVGMSLLLLAGLTLCHPSVLRFVVNLLFRIFHAGTIEFSLKKRHVGAMLVYYLVCSLMAGLSFFMLCSALAPVQWSQFPYLWGSFFAAWTVGFLSMITPAGLGVREGVLFILLRPIYPEAIALLIPVVFRMLVTGCEVLVVAVGFVLPSTKRAEPPTAD